MATNKHAVIRYQALDRCFSNFARRFYIEDLIEACNDAIYDFTGKEDGIERRQLFDDIKFMESEAGYSIELDKVKDGKKKYYRYSDKNFSINKQPLSLTEAEQLKDTIMMLNRFKGLPQFDWMEEVLARFEDTFKLKANVDSVVSFEQNPYLRGIEHFTSLFNAIINKQVLKIEYKASFGESQQYEIHPYFLKQYNNRWFLIGKHKDSEYLSNFAIDRIEGFKETSKSYEPLAEDIDFKEYFSDVVGVSLSNAPVEEVILKVSNRAYGYIVTKPLHESQSTVSTPMEDGYWQVTLKVQNNYELRSLLRSFGEQIEVIAPESLRKMMKDSADAMSRMYNDNKSED